MNPTEQAFRFRLRELCHAEQWDDWHDTRLIFADYLEDEGQLAEAVMARSEWTLGKIYRSNLVQQRKKPWLFTFDVACLHPGGGPNFLPNLTMKDRINGRRLLGFTPYTMRLKKSVRVLVKEFESVREWRHLFSVTAKPRYGDEKIPVLLGIRVDTDVHTDGFAAMWVEHRDTREGMFQGSDLPLLLWLAKSVIRLRSLPCPPTN